MVGVVGSSPIATTIITSATISLSKPSLIKESIRLKIFSVLHSTRLSEKRCSAKGSKWMVIKHLLLCLQFVSKPCYLLLVLIFVNLTNSTALAIDQSHSNARLNEPESQTTLFLIKGMVRIDVPVVGAEVSLKCKAQDKGVLGYTDKTGNFSIKARGVEWPCLLQARGGRVDGAENTLKLHGIVYQSGRQDISPITELSLANAFRKTPETLFDIFPNIQLPTTSQVLDHGVAYVKLQLSQNQLGTLAGNVFADNPDDAVTNNQVIVGLAEKLASSQHSLRDLVQLAVKNVAWQSALTPPANHWKWDLPPTLPEPYVPVNNPMSDAKVELGRYLFYDTRLSGNRKFSCASCHHQDKAFTDGKALAVGSTGQTHPRSSPSIGNAAYNARLTWANPTEMQLEEQIEAPLFGKHPVEMGINDANKQEVILRIQSDVYYQKQFGLAFPNQDNVMSWRNIKKSISAFQRTIITGSSRYDRHIRRERGVEWSDAEENGYILFFTTAKCFACHGSFNFNDTDTYKGGPKPDIRFHNTGLFNIRGTGAFPKQNRGVFEFTKQQSDMGKFRAPSLRNIAVTAPYMHDGSIPTLEKVLDFYAAHGRNIKGGPFAGDGRKNPYKSKDVNEIRLSEQQKADLVAFLKTLTDERFLSNPKLSDPFKKK